MYTPGTVDAWKSDIACAALGQTPRSPFEGPIRVDAQYFLPRPNRLCHKKDPPGPVRHIAKPDIDNLEKTVLDALEKAGFYHNDSQVQDYHGPKWYHAKDQAPGATIWISRWVQEAGE